MDASTSATIAALVVAILAIFVAVMQATQQYIVTGQLIRLCDSVVFGKMPGQGRRIWQMSQFRFRIVYWIPQVSLKKDLWPETLPHIPSYARGTRQLPDLGLLGITQGQDDSKKSETGGNKELSVSVSAGEASWVSFCRAVQLSSGRSMVLDLVQGDADRCPPDLPNVPMQMSMRDIATMGLMTGLKCTEASFKGKSLSMQGPIGTITTSQHPLLGPLLHFSPRNMSIQEIKELQIGTGAVSPFWMARTWDEVVVAGRRYTRKDRIQVEREEDFWAERPRERALVPATRSTSPPPESLYELRRRVSTLSSTTTQSRSSPTTAITSSRSNLQGPLPVYEGSRTLWTRSDGDWYFDNSSQTANQTISPKRHNSKPREQDPQATSGNKTKVTWWDWAKRWGSFLRGHISAIPDKRNDPFETEMERGSSHGLDNVQFFQPTSSRLLDPLLQNTNHNIVTDDKGAQLQPRWLIRDYIYQKRKALASVDSIDDSYRGGPRLIGWYNEDEDEVPELNKTERNIASTVLEAWSGYMHETGKSRTAFYAREWLSIVQRRQAAREKRSRSRSRSVPRSANGHSKFRSRSRRQYEDYPVINRSIDTIYRVHRSPSRTHTRLSRSRSRRSGHTISPQHHESHEDRGNYQKSTRTYVIRRSSSPVSLDYYGNRNRSRSHVRSRPPSAKNVEYGDAMVYNNSDDKAVTSVSPVNKSPVSAAGDRNHASTRVGFDHAVQVFVPPSDSELSDQEAGQVSPVNDAGISSEKLTTNDMHHYVTSSSKGILKTPRESFPEDPNPVREGVAPLKDSTFKDVPPGARWTRIDRKLVIPEALEGKERFEETPTHVTVLRVLSKSEIQGYAAQTHEIRATTAQEDIYSIPNTGSIDSFEKRGRRRRREGSPPPSSPSKSPHSRKNKLPDDSKRSASVELDYSDSGVTSGNTEAHGHDYDTPRDEYPQPSYGSRREDNVSVEGSFKTSSISRSRSRAPPRRTRMYIDIDEGSSDMSDSESEIEEPESIYGRAIRFRRRNSDYNFDDSPSDIDSYPLESIDGWSPSAIEGLGGEMNWFWACQIDVIPGYLATPWTSAFSTQVCIGAITVAIEAIGILTDFTQPIYLDLPYHPRGLHWMSNGLCTFPPYGISANHHHGTVISGAYSTKHFPGFREPLFQIELLRHYGYQVDRNQHSDAADLRARLTELMALDSWLSYCGRQPEICGRGPGQDFMVPAAGAGDLLYTMPTLVQRTMKGFTLEFTNLERTAIDGGQQIVQQIANNLLDTLGWRVEGLTPTEKLFTLVTILRAAKMALCIAQGTDTWILRDILLNDVQVHLI